MTFHVGDALAHIAALYGISMVDALRLMKTPLHPASLRDDFAKAAMQGLISHGGRGFPDRLAQDAYLIADEMLAARLQKAS